MYCEQWKLNTVLQKVKYFYFRIFRPRCQGDDFKTRQIPKKKKIILLNRVSITQPSKRIQDGASLWSEEGQK